jgi:RNA polymerase-binding transcription factor DksA
LTAYLATPGTTARTVPLEAHHHIYATLTAEAGKLRRVIADYSAMLDDLNADPEPDRQVREQVTLARARAVEAATATEHALRRFEDGTYGTCEACGGTIAPARLQALPATAQCIRCAGSNAA